MSADKTVAVEACGLTRIFGEEATRVEALNGIDLRISRGESRHPPIAASSHENRPVSRCANDFNHALDRLR